MLNYNYNYTFSPLLQYCSWTELHEKPADFFKPHCSLDVRKYSFAHWVIDIWNSLLSGIVNASSISIFKHKLEFVDFTPFVRWSSFRPVCFIVLLFSFIGHASVSFGTCMSRLLNKWIWIRIL